jgi:hypothetical protein
MWTTTLATARHAGLAMATTLVLAGAARAEKKPQADGVRLIAQEHAEAGDVTAGDLPGFPVTISEPGSYRLASNLTVSDKDTTAIEIRSRGVTLDLNGFTVKGASPCSLPCPEPGVGVGIRHTGGPTVVLNGYVSGFGGIGVELGPSCRVERITVMGSEIGVRAQRGCTVVNNVVNANRSIGIDAGGGSTVIGNTVRQNFGLGMVLGSSGYAHNVATGNNGGNANPQVSGGIQMGGNICGDAVCP